MPSDKQIAREIVKSWKKEDCISAYHPRLGRLERRIAAALAAARQPEQGAQRDELREALRELSKQLHDGEWTHTDKYAECPKASCVRARKLIETN